MSQKIMETEVVVLGSGPGGYTAAFRSADLGKKTVLIERYSSIGGVCLNVGCIPSKALLHTAQVINEAKAFEKHGVTFKGIEINIEKIREFKDSIVNRLTKGLSGLANQRKVEIVTGYGKFISPNEISVESESGNTVVKFLHAIIASTSMPIAWEPVPSVNVGNTEYKNCVDGAIRENSPLSEVIDEINLDPSNDEYTIIIINCHTGKVNSKPFADANIGQIALRSLYDITLSEIFNTDLKEFIRINDLVAQAGSHRSGLKLLNYDFKNRKRTNKALKDFKAILIEPDANELGDPLAADEDLINHRIAHGRLKAEKSLLGDSPLGGNGQNPNQNGPSSGPPQPGTP